jgi:prophage regulatory protein
MTNQPSPLCIVRIKQLVALLSISKSSVYERINPRSPRFDPSFPSPVKIGHATCFLAHEIDAYIMLKISDSRRTKIGA